jgi:hypothetical protein
LNRIVVTIRFQDLQSKVVCCMSKELLDTGEFHVEKPPALFLCGNNNFSAEAFFLAPD